VFLWIEKGEQQGEGVAKCFWQLSLSWQSPIVMRADRTPAKREGQVEQGRQGEGLVRGWLVGALLNFT